MEKARENRDRADFTLRKRTLFYDISFPTTYVVPPEESVSSSRDPNGSGRQQSDSDNPVAERPVRKLHVAKREHGPVLH
jgi:hypothetical protein